MQGRLFEEAIPAQPRGNGLITIDLTGLEAVRFKVSIGADYPHGEAVLKYLRRVYSSRMKGKTARFLTVIEPFERDSVVRSVTALSADHLRVELDNGTVQDIEVHGFEEDRSNLHVQLTESRDGRILHQESTKPR